MTNAQSSQILKCRDDHLPVRFSAIVDASMGAPEQFSLDERSTCSWATSGTAFGPDKLRARIEPWLTALVQSEHLSLLVGSGLTHAIHGIARNETLPGMSAANFGGMDARISNEAKRAAGVAGRDGGNIEDQIRAANELLRGLEILGEEKANDAKGLRVALTTALNDFAKAILKGEHNLVTAALKQREEAFDYLVSFLMSFASRAGTRERLQLFTTNYDRYVEAGADAAGLRLIDRFVGTLAPVFRASRLDVDLHYNPPGIRGEPRYLEGVARFTKLHGSVDWVESDRTSHRPALRCGRPEDLPCRPRAC